MWKWIIAAVLIAHGGAHLVGVLGSLLGRELEGISGTPTLSVGVLERPLAVLWLVALASLVGAGLAVLLGHGWWYPAAWVGLIASSIAVAVWWSDAWRGAIFNVIVLGVLLMASRIPGLPTD
jgi:hypothetical protein